MSFGLATDTFDRPKHYVCTVEDVTAARQAQAAFRRLVEGTSATGEALFRDLVRALCDALSVLAAPRGLRRVLFAALSYASHEDHVSDELPAVCVRVERSGPAAAVLVVQADPDQTASGSGARRAEVPAGVFQCAALAGYRRIMESFEGALVVGARDGKLVRIFLKVVPPGARSS